MFSGWIICVIGGAAAFAASGRVIMPQALRELIVICICALAAVLLGLWDDRYPMKAGKKFAGQILIACAIVFGGGIRISCFIDNIWISSFISIFWILFILNAINFFDNMDGLAVGTSAIAFLFFTIAAGINGQYLIAALWECSCA